MKTRKCPVCKSETEIKLTKFESDATDKDTGEKIIISGVKEFHCTNKKCGHSWLPLEEEQKIDEQVARRSRYSLTSEQIKLIRESLCFSTKTEAANFLNLNSKAFVKWENGYSEPNSAYDLLLRLAAFDKKTFEFIGYLHSKNFKFNSEDYELIRSKQLKDLGIQFEVAIPSEGWDFEQTADWYSQKKEQKDHIGEEDGFKLYKIEDYRKTGT